MQRRAAAIYGAFFLVLALGSYAMIATASPPPVSIADPDHTATNNSRLSVDGRTYQVGVDNQSERATLSWTIQAANYSAEWADNDTVAFQGTNYTVGIAANERPPAVHLTENRTLPADVQTTEVNGTQYVVVDDANGTRQLVPVGTYLNRTQGPAETRTLRSGQTFDYRNNQTTLAAVENDTATLQWTAPRTNTVEASHGDVIELGGREYVAHFPDSDTLQLDRDVGAYQRQLAAQDTFTERKNGLWGVSILSGLAAILVLGLAYLPSRY